MTDTTTLAEQLLALTGEQLSGLADALGDAGRSRFTEAIREAGSHEDLILDRIRAAIMDAGLNDVMWVVFTSDEWDDGFFVSAHAVAYCRDGTSQPMDVDVHDELTAEFGRVGRTFAYAVDPQSGETYSDDYAIEVYGFTGLDSTHGMQG